MQAKQQKQTCDKRGSGGRVGRARWVVQAPSVAMDSAHPRALYPWWKGETIPLRTRQVARQGSILHPRNFCTHETFTAARAGWHSAAARSWRPGLRDRSGNRRPRPPAFCPMCMDGGVGVYWSRQPCAPTIQHPLSGPKAEHTPARSRRPSLCRDTRSLHARRRLRCAQLPRRTLHARSQPQIDVSAPQIDVRAHAGSASASCLIRCAMTRPYPQTVSD